MRITNKKFNEVVSEVIKRMELRDYKVDEIAFYNVNIKKVRGTEKYDIVVSIDEIEVPLILIRDIIQETCEELGIEANRILVEL